MAALSDHPVASPIRCIDPDHATNHQRIALDLPKLFALLINLPAGIPVAATFRYYHLLHHAHQGEDGTDTDLLTASEGRVLRGPLRKTLWLALQGFLYGLRPMLVYPKKPDRWEVANLVLQLAFDGLVL